MAYRAMVIFTLDVAPEGFRRQAEALAGFLVRWAGSSSAGRFRVRPVRLEGVGPPVHKEAEVVPPPHRLAF